MSIRFACPSCAREYSVKSALAGKGAKCGQCGHKMKIPRAVASHVASSQAATPHAATSRPPAPKSAALKSAVAKPATAKVVAKSAARVAPPKAPPADPGISSWLDEELESVRVEAKAKPTPPPAEASCPSCSGPMTHGAVLCVTCGYDTRTHGRRSFVRAEGEASADKRSKIGLAASLLRGTAFSFLAAMFGAVIWATLAYFTMMEFRFVAWGLGGLAGLGMALGHEDSDGTSAGIIAAFMSLLGIVAAKVLIVVIFVAAAVATMVNEIEFDPNVAPAEMQRSVLAMALAMENLEAAGENMVTVDEDRWDAAMAKSREEVADLTPEEVEARLNELGQQHGLDGELEDFDGGAAMTEDDTGEIDDGAFAADDLEPGDAEEDATFGSVVGSLFGPMDGLFILLAFFTAYKVGSGESSD